jgi:hypothetical protein
MIGRLSVVFTARVFVRRRTATWRALSTSTTTTTKFPEPVQRLDESRAGGLYAPDEADPTTLAHNILALNRSLRGNEFWQPHISQGRRHVNIRHVGQAVMSGVSQTALLGDDETSDTGFTASHGLRALAVRRSPRRREVLVFATDSGEHRVSQQFDATGVGGAAYEAEMLKPALVSDRPGGADHPGDIYFDADGSMKRGRHEGGGEERVDVDGALVDSFVHADARAGDVHAVRQAFWLLNTVDRAPLLTAVAAQSMATMMHAGVILTLTPPGADASAVVSDDTKQFTYPAAGGYATAEAAALENAAIADADGDDVVDDDATTVQSFESDVEIGAVVANFGYAPPSLKDRVMLVRVAPGAAAALLLRRLVRFFDATGRLPRVTNQVGAITHFICFCFFYVIVFVNHYLPLPLKLTCVSFVPHFTLPYQAAREAATPADVVVDDDNSDGHGGDNGVGALDTGEMSADDAELAALDIEIEEMDLEACGAWRADRSGATPTTGGWQCMYVHNRDRSAFPNHDTMNETNIRPFEHAWLTVSTADGATYEYDLAAQQYGRAAALPATWKAHTAAVTAKWEVERARKAEEKEEKERVEQAARDAMPDSAKSAAGETTMVDVDTGEASTMTHPMMNMTDAEKKEMESCLEADIKDMKSMSASIGDEANDDDDDDDDVDIVFVDDEDEDDDASAASPPGVDRMQMFDDDKPQPLPLVPADELGPKTPPTPLSHFSARYMPRPYISAVGSDSLYTNRALLWAPEHHLFKNFLEVMMQPRGNEDAAGVDADVHSDVQVPTSDVPHSLLCIRKRSFVMLSSVAACGELKVDQSLAMGLLRREHGADELGVTLMN